MALSMRSKVLLLSLSLWSLRSGTALATSFCAVYPWGQECTFTNYDACVAAAGSDGGCIFNPQQETPPSDNKAFCLVTDSYSKCVFDDEPPCRLAANIENIQGSTNAECRENPNH